MKKKITSILLVMTLLIASVTPVAAASSPSAKTVKAAYVSYLKKAIKNGKYDENSVYALYDFNGDGVNELVISDSTAGRAGMSICTYKSGKVVVLETGTTDIGYIPGKKYVVSYGSGGALDFDYTVYQIKSGKLKQVMKYACVAGVYKKDGKTIDKSTFTAFTNTVSYDLGATSKIEKKYYTPKKLGISVLPGAKKYTAIKKADKNKVYYTTYEIGSEGMTVNESKLKSAKITSNTKFYYGDTTLLFSGTLSGSDMDSKKWIYEIGKAQFLNKMNGYWGGSDQIIVKNGNVVKVFIHIRVAG